jgi:hypothetical protein
MFIFNEVLTKIGKLFLASWILDANLPLDPPYRSYLRCQFLSLRVVVSVHQLTGQMTTKSWLDGYEDGASSSQNLKFDTLVSHKYGISFQWKAASWSIARHMWWFCNLKTCRFRDSVSEMLLWIGYECVRSYSVCTYLWASTSVLCFGEEKRLLANGAACLSRFFKMKTICIN